MAKRRVFTRAECDEIRESYGTPGGAFGTHHSLARLWGVSDSTIRLVVERVYVPLEDRPAKGTRPAHSPVMARGIDARDKRIAELEAENDALRAELHHVRLIRGEAETQMERLMHPGRDGVVRVDGIEWRGK